VPGARCRLGPDRDARAVEVVGVEQQGDDRVEDALDEAGHDRGESGSDDHGDGEVDHVAPEDELLETLKHGYSLLVDADPPVPDAADVVAEEGDDDEESGVDEELLSFAAARLSVR